MVVEGHLRDGSVDFCQLLVAKTASTLWANLLLKCWDTVLIQVKDNILFESFKDLRNSPLYGSMKLFPMDAVELAIEKSSRVLHEEAIWKAVSLDKPAEKSNKWLQFSQYSRHQRASKRLARQSSVKSVGRSSSSASSSSVKASSSSSWHGWGKKFLKIPYFLGAT